MATAAVTATVVTTSCHEAAGRGGSLVASSLSALDALDEYRLVGTDVHDLGTLAGMRSGTIGAALRARRFDIELQPLETRTTGGAIAYLKVEKPLFLFLEGSMGAVVAAGIATTALPDASAVRIGASATRAASSVDRRRALPGPPQALAPLPPPRLFVRGAQAPTSHGGLPLVAFFLFSLF
jgi:hypothetical protein